LRKEAEEAMNNMGEMVDGEEGFIEKDSDSN